MRSMYIAAIVMIVPGQFISDYHHGMDSVGRFYVLGTGRFMAQQSDTVRNRLEMG